MCNVSYSITSLGNCDNCNGSWYFKVIKRLSTHYKKNLVSFAYSYKFTEPILTLKLFSSMSGFTKVLFFSQTI